MRRGAEVTLITGPVAITPPPFVKVVPVVSAADMAAAVKETADQQDIIIKAAAVADYRPDHPVDEKVKKKDGDATLTMERTEDILSYLGTHKKPGQFLCGFPWNRTHAGKFPCETRKKECGYDCCKQSESSRSRIWNRYKCCDFDYKG